MKKVLFTALLLALCINSHAQIISSSSRSITYTEKVKPAKKTTWFMRLGMNCMSLGGPGAEGLSGKIGYDYSIGFKRTMGSLGAYWGMDLALGSRGFKGEYSEGYYKATAHNLQYSPFTFGWDIKITDLIKLDPHLGAYLSVDYASKIKYKEIDESYDWDYVFSGYQPFDAGMNLGIGIWINRFNFDLTYQHGFFNVFDAYESNKTNNFMIRIGVAF